MLAVLAAMLALPGGYVWGRIDGRAAGKVDQLEATIEAVEQRKGIDNEVSGLGRDGLCLELGGMPDECAALRRSDEAAARQ